VGKFPVRLLPFTTPDNVRSKLAQPLALITKLFSDAGARTRANLGIELALDRTAEARPLQQMLRLL
jgi:hypothetical protein